MPTPGPTCSGLSRIRLDGNGTTGGEVLNRRSDGLVSLIVEHSPLFVEPYRLTRLGGDLHEKDGRQYDLTGQAERVAPRNGKEGEPRQES